MVTYLLGAGASANAIPTIGKKFIDRFEYFINFLTNPMGNGTLSFMPENKDLELINALSEIKKKMSPDHYAKIIYDETNNGIDSMKYHNVKHLLASYIIWEQIGKEKFRKEIEAANSLTSEIENNIIAKGPNTTNEIQEIHVLDDIRYSHFLSKIRNPTSREISFVSWNYDWQLEKAMKLYTKTKTVSETIIKQSNYIKLNGFANIATDNKIHGSYENLYFQDFDDVLDNDTIDFFKKGFFSIRLFNENYLRFAWEANLDSSPNIIRAKDFFSKTTDLVMIGYTFPDYNRAVDSALLCSMYKNNYHVAKTIHLQYPTIQECKRIESKITKIIKNKTGLNDSTFGQHFQFDLLGDDESVSEFYVPDELLT